MLIQYPELVRQHDDKSCVIACLSMVTGVPYYEVLDRVEQSDKRFGGVDMLTEARFLVQENILPVPKSHLATPNETWSDDGVYLVSMPSLNLEGRMHALVLFTNAENRWTLRDPQTGREGKQWYPEGCFNSDVVSDIPICYANLTRLIDCT